VSIKSPIEAMYVAGKQDIPAEAELVSGIANRLYDHLQSLDVQAARAGDPAIMRSMLSIGGQVYDVMRGTVVSLDHCASSIIKTADDFVATDEDAAADYQHLGTGLKTLDVPTHQVPPALPDPSQPGAVDPNQPTRMGQGDFQPHDPVVIGSTPDPVDPDTDHDQRDQTQQQGQQQTPVVPPVVER
jgi:hypothetical protein